MPAATDVREGQNGVVVAVGVASVTATTATEYGTPPYPCKLDVALIDISSNSSALTCASARIIGKNQFGDTVTETVLLVTETPQETVNVYESVSSVSAATCANGADSDVLRLTCSNEIGLPYHLSAETQLLSVCLFDVSTTDTFCPTAAQFATDLGKDSIEFDGITMTPITYPTIAQGDYALIRVRAPAN
jgi:hypothetical protein